MTALLLGYLGALLAGLTIMAGLSLYPLVQDLTLHRRISNAWTAWRLRRAHRRSGRI